MKYELFEGDAEHAVATANLEDNLDAESWAKNWVRENATTDTYTLRRADRGLSLSIFRTKAGQWYLTPTLGVAKTA